MFSTSGGGGFNREGGLNKSGGFIRGGIIYGGVLNRENTVCAPSPFRIFMAKCHYLKV